MIKEKTYENSTQVSKTWYDEEKKVMFVTFKTGKTYSYDEVPAEVYEKSLQAESIGKFLNTDIKGKYSYKAI